MSDTEECTWRDMAEPPGPLASGQKLALTRTSSGPQERRGRADCPPRDAGEVVVAPSSLRVFISS